MIASLEVMDQEQQTTELNERQSIVWPTLGLKKAEDKIRQNNKAYSTS